MERINEEDVDCYLQQMEHAFSVPPERDKRQEPSVSGAGFTDERDKVLLFHSAGDAV